MSLICIFKHVACQLMIYHERFGMMEWTNLQEGRLFLFLSQGFLMFSSLPLHTCWNSHSLKRLKNWFFSTHKVQLLSFKEVPSYVANGICSLALHPLNCQVTCWITLFTLNVLHYNLLFLKKFFLFLWPIDQKIYLSFSKWKWYRKAVWPNHALWRNGR